MARRIAIGLLLAALVLAVLQIAVRGESDPPRGDAPDRSPSPPVRETTAEILDLVRGGGPWLYYLTDDAVALPDGVRPVLRIDRAGRLRLLRPPAPAESPADVRWLALGIELGSSRPSSWNGDERAALLDVIAAVAGARRVTGSQFVVVGGDPDADAEIARLLRWRR